MERINPAIKTVMCLVLGLALSFCYLIPVHLVMIALCTVLLLRSRADRKQVGMMAGAAVLTALSLFFTFLWFGKGTERVQSGNFAMAVIASGSVRGGLTLAVRILSFAAVGIVYAFTTRRDELIASCIHQLKMPPKYAYGILAAFNFAGNIRREYGKVRLAFRVRGVRTGLFSIKPLFVMLVNALHWSGDIAAAMETRGFDGSRARTWHHIPKVTGRDRIFLVLTSAMTIGCLVLSFRFR